MASSSGAAILDNLYSAATQMIGSSMVNTIIELVYFSLLLLPVYGLLVLATFKVARSNEAAFEKSEARFYKFGIFFLCIIGGIAGYLGGMSRVGVVGQLTPAILGLIGTAVVYFLGTDQAARTPAQESQPASPERSAEHRDSDLKRKTFTLALAVSLVASFGIFYFYGSQLRVAYTKQNDEVAFCEKFLIEAKSASPAVAGLTEKCAKLLESTYFPPAS